MIQNKKYISLLFIAFHIFFFNEGRSQGVHRGKFSFYVTELELKDSTFLHTLDSIILEIGDCLQADSDEIYIMEIFQKKEYYYKIEIYVSELMSSDTNSIGYFKDNNRIFFIKGVLPTKPKPVFVKTNKSELFSIIFEYADVDSSDFIITCGPHFYVRHLEYRYGRLLYNDSSTIVPIEDDGDVSN